jgi:dipeptidase D
VLETAVRTHAELYGSEPKVEAIHAGLECGIIGEKYPGMDMVSLGPTIRGAHSPDERVNIPSVGRYWDYLLAVLKNIG